MKVVGAGGGRGLLAAVLRRARPDVKLLVKERDLSAIRNGIDAPRIPRQGSRMGPRRLWIRIDKCRRRRAGVIGRKNSQWRKRKGRNPPDC